LEVGIQKVSETARDKKKGRLFVVSGPSGSGKSTLCREVIKRTEARLSVSVTTRTPGANEVEGKDYYFLDEPEFLRRAEAGEFLEYAKVFDYYYGTPAQEVNEQMERGATVVLEIDVQGAAQVFEKLAVVAKGILILPPNDEELRRRLCGRGRDDADTIDKRLAKAKWEIEQARSSGRYEYTIINDDLNQAIEQMVGIIEQ
jgi:guanylate kinase